jgi:hypothetical protein
MVSKNAWMSTSSKIVHLPAHDPDVDRVQRIVLAAAGPEAVGEAQEVGLVDRVEHRRHGVLDDFVLQRRDAQRPHPPVGLGNKCPLRRLRPVGALVDPRVPVRLRSG